ncbi:MAG: glycine cleavage system aminomethyltransferase GcvT [Candidatus Omnitrophota bacterium]
MKEKVTRLLEEHKQLKARMAGFGGWLMPIQYQGIITEHNWTRKKCSIFDICHMGEFIVQVPADDLSFEKIVTVNTQKMPVKSCKYGFMLNQAGGIIDDVLVYRIKDNEYMLVVNAATKDSDKEHLRKNLSKNTEWKDISQITGKLDLQGPQAKAVLKMLIDKEKFENLKYYNFDRFNILNENIIISRTGYTGELGYELYISNDKISELWKTLLSDERVKPAGLGARDTLRLEAGYPLYSQDIDINITPLEAGFEKVLDFSKDFIGKESLAKQKAAGITKKLTFFITESRRAPRHNYDIFFGDKKIGVVTSGSFSPSLTCGIGMGYVDINFITPGTEIILKDKEIEIKAKITEKPFYKKGTARI